MDCKVAARIWAVIIPLVLGFGAERVGAQDDASSASSSREQPKPAGITSPATVVSPNTDGTDAPVQPSGPVSLYSGELKDAGTGLPLFGTSATPLRWGDFSIGSFEYIGIHDQVDAAGVPGSSSTLSILRTGLMFDRNLWKSRIVLQYLPQAVFVDGQFHANAVSNNTLSLGSTFMLTPRMSLTVQDTFLQVHENQLVPENYLASDTFGGGVVQNNFLTTNGTFLANTASATLQYGFSARTTLSVSPSFRYSQATFAPDPGQTLKNVATGETYEGIVAVSHALSPYRRIGIADSYQLLQESSSLASPSARFNTTTVFYSQQVSRSWWITGSLGAEHQSGIESGWGLGGTFSLNGSLSPRLSAALALTRGVTLNNYVSTRRSDRIDASFGYRVSSRMTWTNGVGYFRELGSDPRTFGKYGTTGFTYNFYGHVSFFTTYAYSFQNASTSQLLSGSRSTVAYGVIWQPGRVAGH